jgi:hypothetical protein
MTPTLPHTFGGRLQSSSWANQISFPPLGRMRHAPDKRDARYLRDTLIGAPVEAWLQCAVGDDPDPVPHLQRVLALLTLA